MMICRQACPFNTLEGCKVEEYNAICPMSNSVTPITEYRMTNADKIRALDDEKLANYLIQFTDLDCRIGFCQNLPKCDALLDTGEDIPQSMCEKCLLKWLQQPAEETK